MKNFKFLKISKVEILKNSKILKIRKTIKLLKGTLNENLATMDVEPGLLATLQSHSEPLSTIDDMSKLLSSL